MSEQPSSGRTTIGFEGRAVVVTGAGSGLGRCHALELARRGAQVVVNDAGTAVVGGGSSPEPADQVTEEIRTAGGEAIANHDSVASSAGGRAIVEACLDTYGRIDAVIHNAGIIRCAAFEDLTDEDVELLLSTHLAGGFHVGRPAFRAMRATGYGRFVLTSSGAGLFGAYHQSSYMAAKAGLLGLNNALAIEGAECGIRSNCILPIAATRMVGPAIEADHSRPEDGELMGGVGALGEMRPEFVTPLAIYLASEACAATQQAFSAMISRYARVFVGVTQGWYGPTDAPATAEDIDAHFAEIGSLEDFAVPRSVYEEGAIAAAGLGDGAGGGDAGHPSALRPWMARRD